MLDFEKFSTDINAFGSASAEVEILIHHIRENNVLEGMRHKSVAAVPESSGSRNQLGSTESLLHTYTDSDIHISY